MIRARTLALAASLTAGIATLATPAAAQYVRIGSVEIHHRGDHETQWNRFGGRMEGLRLIAENRNIHCKSIRVQYGNGHWDRVYRGRLYRGRPITVDLRGHKRKVRQIRFICGVRHHRRGRIAISADVGRYAYEWRRSPYWARTFARLFGGRYGHRHGYRHHGHHRGNWERVGYERFGGHRDHERTWAGRGGRHVYDIALRPRYNDARCRRVKVTFANGHTRRLDINRHDRMHQGRLYPLDLPGRRRNIRRVDMVCHGVHHAAVGIEVLAR
jgi:hypothetical protein